MRSLTADPSAPRSTVDLLAKHLAGSLARYGIMHASSHAANLVERSEAERRSRDGSLTVQLKIDKRTETFQGIISVMKIPGDSNRGGVQWAPSVRTQTHIHARACARRPPLPAHDDDQMVDA